MEMTGDPIRREVVKKRPRKLVVIFDDNSVEEAEQFIYLMAHRRDKDALELLWGRTAMDASPMEALQIAGELGVMSGEFFASSLEGAAAQAQKYTQKLREN